MGMGMAVEDMDRAKDVVEGKGWGVLDNRGHRVVKFFQVGKESFWNVNGCEAYDQSLMLGTNLGKDFIPCLIFI
ncbi:hypothetical protein Y032_0053g2314 [Ancylostoma ceylanicum]|uniref:Uncharacterized protein n=1 Tax=Ancylostoma ceylanicum TaxID=53326 RepID=A0A016U665_9BILA|nr:hypothetical protein Y032_0053g2314 [Ancylostoma ceylanicum]